MGLLSDFFALNDEEFARVLKGWKRPAPPLDTERELQGVNPFTGAPLVIRTRANPEQPEADADAVSAPKLTSRHHVVSSKWITSYELAELAIAFGAAETLDEANDLVGYAKLIGPPDAYGDVHEVPAVLIERIADAGADKLNVAAAKWVAVRGPDAFPPWTAEDLLEPLTQVRELAIEAQWTRRRVYLHCGEP